MGRKLGFKRARVETPMASLVRHPMPEVMLGAVTSDPRPKKTTLDSLRFLLAMKCKLYAAGEMGKYHAFLAALRAFKAGSMDAAGLAAYVNAVLIGHQDLIHGFSEFLPRDYVRSHGPAEGGASGI